MSYEYAWLTDHSDAITGLLVALTALAWAHVRLLDHGKAIDRLQSELDSDRAKGLGARRGKAGTPQSGSSPDLPPRSGSRKRSAARPRSVGRR